MKLFLFAVPEQNTQGVVRAMNEKHAEELVRELYKGKISNMFVALYTLEDRNDAGILNAKSLTQFDLK